MSKRKVGPRPRGRKAAAVGREMVDAESQGSAEAQPRSEVDALLARCGASIDRLLQRVAPSCATRESIVILALDGASAPGGAIATKLGWAEAAAAASERRRAGDLGPQPIVLQLGRGQAIATLGHCPELIDCLQSPPAAGFHLIVHTENHIRLRIHENAAVEADMVARMRRLESGEDSTSLRSIGRAALDAALDEVDEDLRRAGRPAFQRPIAAVGMIAKKFGVSIALTPVYGDDEGAAACRDTYWMTTRIHTFFEERYGDKLKARLGSGRIAVQIRGDAWLIHLPWLIGSHAFAFDIDVPQTSGGIYPVDPNKPRPTPILNVAHSVAGLTPSVARSLDRKERTDVVQQFKDGLRALDGLQHAEQTELIELARGDINAAVDHLVGQAQHSGLSKWASLQATEKVLKQALIGRGIKPKFTHILADLVNELAAQGGPTIPASLLDPIICKAEIRYSTGTTVAEALAAHRGSIAVILRLLGALPKRTGGRP